MSVTFCKAAYVCVCGCVCDFGLMQCVTGWVCGCVCVCVCWGDIRLLQCV